MSNYKFTYLNARGRAEVCRWIFAKADVDYEDIRIEKEDWPAKKKTLPGVPYLEDGALKIGHCNTVARYLARKFGLAGKGADEEARADMIVDCVEEMLKPLFHWMFFAPEEQKSDLSKRWDEELKPTFLKNLENLLKANGDGNGYFVGDGMTWADMTVVFGLTWIKNMNFGTYPKLKGHKARVEADPKIAAWIAKRPPTDL